MKYTEVAKKAPHCMNCMLPNPEGKLLCLAHCNVNIWGGNFGRGIKSEDVCGAFLCDACHTLSEKKYRRDFQWWLYVIHRSLTWAAANGYLVVGDGKC